MNEESDNPTPIITELRRLKKEASHAIENLLPQHLEDLRRSGLLDEQILACGFRSEANPAIWSKHLNWKPPRSDSGAAMCIPYFGTDGKPFGYVRLKLDKPRMIAGKPIKYESAKGSHNRAYFPPGTRAALADPTKPLILTEGEKKAAKADQEGFPCIGLTGVNGWQNKRPKDAAGKGTGERQLIPDLAAIDWRGRYVTIAFDSDLIDNPNVQWAECHLAEALTKVGANVKAIRIPAAADGSKQGLDDFLIAAGPDGLKRLLEDAKAVDKPKDDRPIIVMSTEEHRVIREAISALASEPTIYQRGGMLVHIVETDAGSAVIRALPNAMLRESLTRCAQLKRVKGRDDDATTYVPAHPPEWLVRGVCDRHDWRGIRRLNAVVTHPVLLPDGSILKTPGYHAASKLFVSIPAGLKLTIPDNPTCADVKASLKVLFDPLDDFPFETPAHRSAWLAGLFTPLARFAFEGPAPWFLIDGNVRAIGKGLLVDAIGLIITGRRFSTMAYTNDPAELRKKITMIAMEGRQFVLFDNLAGPVGNEVLDAALTATDWTDRILGGNRQYDGPLNVTWYGTGNNVQLQADTSRRVCHIRLESEDEKPETKSGFKYPNLREHVLSQRGPLLSAALTILRAWYVAGKPSQNLPAWGSYEGWSMIRDVIVFAGLADPGETRLALQSNSDRDATAMETILRGMLQLDESNRGLTAAEIIGKLKDPQGSRLEWMLEMRSAVEELCGRLNSSDLSYKLRSFKGRNFAGMMLDVAGEKNGSKRWLVRRLDSKAKPRTGDTGDKGDVSPRTATEAKRQTGDTGHPGDISPHAATVRSSQPSFGSMDWKSQMLPD